MYRFPIGTSIRLIILALVLVLYACHNDAERIDLAPNNIPILDVETKHILSIQADSIGNEFGDPSGIFTDKEGNIYVGDRASSTIKVYSREGIRIGELGASGHDPGEFVHLTALARDSDSTLIVADEIDDRITVLSLDGKVLGVYDKMPSDRFMWPRIIVPDSSEGYFVLYRLPERVKGNSEHVIHQMDSKLQSIRATFASVSSVIPHRNTLWGNSWRHEFAKQYFEIRPGSIVVLDPEHVVYAPSLYEGVLYSYRKTNGRWVEDHTRKGYVESASAIVEPSTDYKEPVSLRSPKGNISAIINNESLGLFLMGNGEIMHVTATRRSGAYTVGIEVFSIDGLLLGYGPLPDFLYTDNHPTSPYVFFWKDDDESIYYIDWTGVFPVLNAVSISYHVRR